MDMTLADMALAWILANKDVTSVIVGASSVEQLSVNLRAASMPPLSAAAMAEIENVLSK